MSDLAQSEARVAEASSLGREVLEAIARQDVLSYLRRRCAEPQPVFQLFRRLADERRLLESLVPEDQDAAAIQEELGHFFAELEAEAGRWVVSRVDQAVVWPWREAEAAAGPLLASQTLPLLRDTSRRIHAELDLKRLMPLLVERAAALTGSAAVFLAFLDPADGRFEVVESRGLSARAERRLALPATVKQHLKRVESAQAIERSPACQFAPLLQALDLERVGLAVLRYRGELLGLLGCSLADQADAAQACEMLTFLTDQTVVAIRNAAHYREVVHKAAALREANEQLMSLDRMKDQFLATISHELRTPLNFITGFGAILRDDEECGALNEQQRYFLQKMLDGAAQLAALVSDLLDYSRIRAGHLTLQLEPLEPAPLLREQLELFQVLAAESGHHLHLRVPETLGLVRGDRQRLKQVLANLLTNAIKFTPAGGTITLSAERQADGLVIAVEDTGIGIRHEQRALLFERFSQLDSGFTRNFGGAGLGLAICKSLVQAHGGTIDVASPPPGQTQGSRFWFRLPPA